MSLSRTRLRVFVTHPVQYHVPLWRALASDPRLDVKVFYFSDQGVRAGVDKGFGVTLSWDVDLLSGYRHEFISRDAPLDRPADARIPDVDGLLAREAPDWVLFSGYTHAFERQLRRRAHRQPCKLLMRAEFSDLSFRPRSLPKRALRAAYLRWFYAGVDGFCYPGEGGRQHLLRHGVAPTRMFRSPYSVDNQLLERQKDALPRAQARAALGLKDEQFAFILSGKLIPRKAPLMVLDAIARIADRRRIVLIVLGDGELRVPFVERAQALLGDRFIFPGFVNQSQLSKYFLAADVLVMPSLFETWGLVVNEAMHHALPCIVSSQVGCAPDLVLPGRTGWIVPAGDASGFAHCLRAALDDAAATRRMGAQALERIQGFTVERSAAGVVSALGLTAPQPAELAEPRVEAP